MGIPGCMTKRLDGHRTGLRPETRSDGLARRGAALVLNGKRTEKSKAKDRLRRNAACPEKFGAWMRQEAKRLLT